MGKAKCHEFNATLLKDRDACRFMEFGIEDTSSLIFLSHDIKLCS